MPVQNAAAMFDHAAELLEIGGENQFRVRAYRRAARVIEGLPKAAGALLKSGRDLSELPGIGKDLAGKITDIVKTGRFDLLDKLKRKLPGELGDMAALPGLGPKRIKLLCPAAVVVADFCNKIGPFRTSRDVRLESGMRIKSGSPPTTLDPWFAP